MKPVMHAALLALLLSVSGCIATPEPAFYDLGRMPNLGPPLLAGSVYAPINQHKYGPDFDAWFDSAKIGDTYSTVSPAGDGCNTCSVELKKISNDTVARTGYLGCTLIACFFGSLEKVR